MIYVVNLNLFMENGNKFIIHREWFGKERKVNKYVQKTNHHIFTATYGV